MVPPTNTNAEAAAAPFRWKATWEDFANWAADQLGLVMEFTGVAYQLRQKATADHAVTAEAPGHSGLGASLKSRLHFGRAKGPADATKVYSTPTALAEDLLVGLSQLSPLPDLAPSDQPERVHDIAAKLIPAYQVDGGGIHIAGCSFEDVPFYRLTTVDEAGAQPVFWHTLLDKQGNPVDQALVQALGLTDTKQLEYHPNASVCPAELDQLLAEGSQDAVVRCTAVTWAKRVSGNLQFTIGEANFRAPFSGWARSLEPRAITCPLTGVPSFRFAALENGAIAAASEIAECEVSRRRLLKRDLVTCAVTGKRVAAELCEACPASGEPTRREFFATCADCGQRVSQASLQGKRCLACRAIKPVAANDARLIAVLSVYPGLERLKRWSMADTKEVYLLKASKGIRRYFFVLDRRDLSVRKAARLSVVRGQRELSETARRSLMGG